MRRILNFFKKRSVIATLILLIVVGLIWFVTPIIPVGEGVLVESPVWRLVFILIAVLVWAIILLWLQSRGSPEAKPVEQEPEVTPEEVELLDYRFTEAQRLLKNTYGKKDYRYALPWYLVLGAAGAGKTNLLASTGLPYPLAERAEDNPLKQAGPTNNCMWWITDQAVMIDTPGDLSTQIGDANTLKLWQRLLQKLKSQRRRQPLNGIVLTVDLHQLLSQNEHERAASALSLRCRLEEISKSFAISVPVYLMFTKTDLVAGFSEFFANLDRDARQQIWGITFPHDQYFKNEDLVTHFSQEYKSLTKSLNDRLLTRLQQERDPNARAQIYTYPQRMDGLINTIATFLANVLPPHRQKIRPQMRGVYFSSAQQTDAPTDLLQVTLARSLKLPLQTLPVQTKQNRSYFIHRLFTQLIFLEAGLAGKDKKFERRNQITRIAAYAATALLLIGVTVTWAYSYNRNEAAIAQLDDKLVDYKKLAGPGDDNLRKADVQLRDLTHALNTLNDAYEVFPEDSPLGMSFGLYQGDRLKPAVKRAYQRLLRQLFLPRVAVQVEEQLKNGADETEYLYQALRVYLMLSNTARRDPEVVKYWMDLDWRQIYTGKAGLQRDLLNHLDIAMQDPEAAIQPNTALIKATRTKLRRTPQAALVYNQLKEAGQERYAGQLDWPSSVDINFYELFVQPPKTVERIFTYDAFHDYFEKNMSDLVEEIGQEDWVLGDIAAESQTDTQQLRRDVSTLYLGDYEQNWRDAINNLTVLRFRSVQHASEVLELASSPTSPIRGLLQKLQYHTTLAKPLVEVSNDGAFNEATKLIGTTGSKVRRLNDAAKKAGMEVPTQPGERINQAFRHIHRFMGDKDDKNAPVDEIMAALNELFGQMKQIADAPEVPEAALAAVKTKMETQDDAITRLKRAATRAPNGVRQWLETIADESWQVILASAYQQLNTLWATEVYPDYQQKLYDRYPLYRTSNSDVMLDDFTAFFGPGGTIDSFFQQHLKPFINEKTWQMRRIGGSTLPISDNALLQIRRAYQVRQAFFAGGDIQANLSIRPTRLDPSIARAVLEVEGLQIEYSHGPQRITDIIWPNRQAAETARLTFFEYDKGGQQGQGQAFSDNAKGPWSLFKLLGHARLKKISADRYTATFRIKGRQATFTLQANSVINPLSIPQLEKFRCPNRL